MRYQILPFRFLRFSENKVFLSNEVGEYIFLTSDQFDKFIHYELNPSDKTFLDLKSKHTLSDTEIDPVVSMLATKYRTKKSFLDNFTALHMVVPTLRCNSSCKYCQVSRKELENTKYDMNKRTAKKTVDLIFGSPSPVIKIEFQGGEPPLNFEIIKYIIEYAEVKNMLAKKHLEFVVCTNLSLITKEILIYFKKHNVSISTSLDGPKDIHNVNRPLQGTDNTYDIFIEKLELCRKILGKDGISALMTTSKYSIGRFRDVVDEYVRQGFKCVFFRSLNPYGFAEKYRSEIGYEIEEFIENYKDILTYVIDINKKGTYIEEGFASILLSRLLTPFSTGFVDMQSPAGVVICGVVYDYNGDVYISDEARMLASMGDKKFLIGNVNEHSYQEIFYSDLVKSIIKSSCLECLPECSYCGFQSYCGADPVRNYSEQGDIIGNRTASTICKRNKEILKFILELLEEDDDSVNNVFWSWIMKRSIKKDDDINEENTRHCT